MAEISALGDYGEIKIPNMLDLQEKEARTQKYNLDVAGAARDFYALKQYGEGAARGDPEDLVQLQAKNPNAASTYANIRSTTANALQQEQSTRKEMLGQAALQMYHMTDPSQKMAFGMNMISEMEKSNRLPPLQAQGLRQQLTTDPRVLDSWIYQNLPPGAIPEIQARTEGYRKGIELKGKEVERTWGPEEEGRPVWDPKAIDPETGKPGMYRAPYFPPTRFPHSVRPESAFPGPGGGGAPIFAPPTGAPGARPGPGSSLSPSGARTTDGYGSSLSPMDTGYDKESSGELPAPAFVARLHGDESNNQNLRNPRSSASGVGQFIDSTWLNQAPKVTDTTGMSRDQILALKSDSRLQEAATLNYANENAAVLARAGVPVNSGTLAMAHKLGPGGAVKVLTADPATPMTRLLSPDAAAANPVWARQTAGGFVNSNYNKFTNRPVAGIAAPPPTGAAPAAPGSTVPPGAPTVTSTAPAPMPPPAAPGGAPSSNTRGIIPAVAPGSSVPPPLSSTTRPSAPAAGAGFDVGGADSIGLGASKFAGVPGKFAASRNAEGAAEAHSVGGRNPQEALDYLNDHPDEYAGKKVFWSSGIMNAGPNAKAAAKALPIVEEQLTSLVGTYGSQVVLAGADQGKYNDLNPQLQEIAERAGAKFGGPLPTKNVHPGKQGYQDYVSNAARLLEEKRSEAEPEALSGGSSGPVPTTAPGAGEDTTSPASSYDTPATTPSSTTLSGADRGGAGDPLAGSPPPPGGRWAPTPEELKRQEKSMLNPIELQQREKALRVKQMEDDQAEGQLDYKDILKESHSANIGLRNLDTLSNILDRGLVTGPTTPYQKEILGLVTEVSNLMGKNAGWAEQKVAMLALFDSVSKELGFNMVNALGSREAMQVVKQVMEIKPSITHPIEANRLIIASLKAAFQMQIDKRNFYEDHAKTKAKDGDWTGYHGGQREFEKTNPIQVYSSSVVPYQIKPGTPDSKLIKNVTYDLSGQVGPKGEKPPFQYGKYAGNGDFDPVDPADVPVANISKGIRK